jgi:hypothetical protein
MNDEKPISITTKARFIRSKNIHIAINELNEEWKELYGNEEPKVILRYIRDYRYMSTDEIIISRERRLNDLKIQIDTKNNINDRWTNKKRREKKERKEKKILTAEKYEKYKVKYPNLNHTTLKKREIVNAERAKIILSDNQYNLLIDEEIKEIEEIEATRYKDERIINYGLDTNYDDEDVIKLSKVLDLEVTNRMIEADQLKEFYVESIRTLDEKIKFYQNQNKLLKAQDILIKQNEDRLNELIVEMKLNDLLFKQESVKFPPNIKALLDNVNPEIIKAIEDKDFRIKMLMEYLESNPMKSNMDRLFIPLKPISYTHIKVVKPVTLSIDERKELLYRSKLKEMMDENLPELEKMEKVLSFVRGYVPSEVKIDIEIECDELINNKKTELLERFGSANDFEYIDELRRYKEKLKRKGFFIND